MAKNANLHNAKTAKNDEFYTQLSDIEKEMKYYRPFFKGKVVYCNCDDARESNFFKYFASSFEFLGLKKLITTGYKENGHGVVLVYEGDKNGNKVVDDNEITITELEGNGDFRSAECIEFLKEADIVVTNPPFSLYREYIAQLVEYDKKFILIGPMNSITYKEIFPLIKEDKLWAGVNASGGTKKGNSMSFSTPDSEDLKDISCWWFTNVEHDRRHEPLDLYKVYSNEDYPKYDNYDAIEVAKTCEIPMDYDGVMGVPISFLDKYCPEQFEIVGATESEGIGFSSGIFTGGSVKQALVNGNKVYKRLFIRKVSE